MDNTIRTALVTVIKSNRQKMSRDQRRRGVKPQRWLYPYATEARYAATIRAWLRPMTDYVHEYLKDNAESVLRGDSADLPDESVPAQRLDAVPGKSFEIMINSLQGWLAQYVPDDAESKSGSPIYIELGNIADSTFDFNEGQFEKGAKSVLGVEFPVGEDWWPFARDMWANKNYDLIKDTLMKQYIAQVNDLTEKAVTSGLSVKQLAKQILSLDDKIKKSKANLIARDQIGKLNGEITQRRMESVGLTMYIWSTSGDERVRPSHEMMDGGLCRWSDPSVYSDDGGKTWKPRPSGAVTQHPGFDIQCRCTALSCWQELVGEADAMIAEYEELDTLSAANIEAIPNTTQPAAVLVPEPKKYITQKVLQGQVTDLEKQIKAIDPEASLVDKQLYDDLKAKKETIEAEIEKKKIAAQKNLLMKKVKKLEKEIQDIQVKTYSGIWKDDVTTADYEEKAAGIQAKKQYFLDKLNAGGLSDSDKAKYTLFLKDLDEFEAEGNHYADIQAAIKKAKNSLTSLKKNSKVNGVDNPFTQERKDAALWAKTPKAADDALREVCGEVWQNASKAERKAIFEYTEGSGGFNRPLRGYDGNWQDFKGVGKVPLNNEGRGTAIKNMTKLIDRSKYDFDVWLQRGIESAKGAAEFLGISEDNLRHWSQAELHKNLIDKSVTDEAFVSCGSSKGKGFSGYIFNIYCPKGTKMMYAEPFSHYGDGDKLHWDSISKRFDGISKQSDFGYEDETIIQRGTKFKVIKVEKKGIDIFFDVEVVEQI
ncbi:MAG: minor capsid protein [Treponema sp.]|jgi:SPP1 gp7 family putative phage head morphogenesis protein|nr:minor capsid protein [Treponema sp.]